MEHLGEEGAAMDDQTTQDVLTRRARLSTTWWLSRAVGA
jgi:hypothetical protein